jgi:hydrogenase maturation factor
LLVAVDPAEADDACARLSTVGCPAMRIGEVVPGRSPLIEVL